MTYTIHGKPIPLKRPRVTTTHFVKVYDPQKHEKEEARQQLYLQKKRNQIIDEPISINITFFMPIPKSLSPKKKYALIGQKHHKKPDLSNLIKYLEDTAQGVLFTDDARITTINAQKIYDINPRTEFIIITETNEKKENPPS